VGASVLAAKDVIRERLSRDARHLARLGLGGNTFRRHYGSGGAPDILMARGASRDFNPTIPQSEVDRALEADRVRNTPEFVAEFRSDVKGLQRSRLSRPALATIARDYRSQLLLLSFH
jgi:hypothetical protein